MLIGFVGIRLSKGNLMLDHSIEHYLLSVDYLSLGRKFGGNDYCDRHSLVVQL